jgi:hypothetical protein
LKSKEKSSAPKNASKKLPPHKQNVQTAEWS